MQNIPTVADSATVASQTPTIYHELVIGIVSGVVTAGLLWLTTVFWRNVLEPWFEARVYRGLDVAGIWELENTANEFGKKPFDDDEAIEMRQSAHRLSGRLTFHAAGEPSKTRSHQVSGMIRDRLVCFTSQSSDRQSVGYTSVLAEVATDGKTMRGHVIYYDLDTSQIESSAVTYTRKT